jgi:glycosyltransferase involved in cell wall biosynthesis
MKLSALVVAHNEEAQLRDCLSHLAFADEIVVVLDKCTDSSKTIAQEFTTQIIEGAWPIEGDRRNRGIDFCRGEWIIEVDADERVTQALGTEIKNVIARSSADYHLVPVDNYIGKRLVRYGWGGSFGRSAYPGLFRKGSKIWGNERVHPRLELKGVKGEILQNRLVHYVDRNISDMIKRLDRYSTLNAADIRDKQQRGISYGGMARQVRRFFSRFIKCFCFRGGWREGGYGLLLAICAGLYPLLSYLKAKNEQ